MDRGLSSFCDRKQINAIKTVKMFTKETGFKVEDNFSRFATFVDKKIKSGELKGNDAPLNKDMWDESRRKQEEHTAEMKTFTYEHKAFYRKFKENNSALDSFFGKLKAVQPEIQKPKQTESKTKLGKMIPIFDYLKDNGLLEEFMNYEYVKQ
jgi:hypothetical protein